MDNAFGDMPHLPAGFKQAAATLHAESQSHESWTDPAELVSVARLGGVLDLKAIF